MVKYDGEHAYRPAKKQIPNYMKEVILPVLGKLGNEKDLETRNF